MCERVPLVEQLLQRLVLLLADHARSPRRRDHRVFLMFLEVTDVRDLLWLPPSRHRSVDGGYVLVEEPLPEEAVRGRPGKDDGGPVKARLEATDCFFEIVLHRRVLDRRDRSPKIGGDLHGRWPLRHRSSDPLAHVALKNIAARRLDIPRRTALAVLNAL